MGGKFVKLCIVICILTIFSMPFISYNTEAVSAPVIRIQFNEDEEEQTADVRPGENGTVVFPGAVEALIPAGSDVQDLNVYLEGSVDVGWPLTLDPDVVQINPGDVVPFVATVWVPPETSYYALANLTVSGTPADPYPGPSTYIVTKATGSIRIAQYYKFILTSENVSEEVKIGGEVSFELKIDNLGNGRDTFSVNIGNYDELAEKEIKIRFSDSSFDTDEKSRRTIKVIVDIPRDTKCIGTHKIIVEVHSEKGESQGEKYVNSMVYTLKVADDNIFLETIAAPGILPLIIIIVVIIIIAAYIKKRRSSY
jgi:hypothetical protein